MPGTLLLQRYRIVAPLGRGGMAEVFRAEDLKLGQTVALKFLPPALAHDPAWLARFLGEVRVARQVSHPNVCRVHDIGEVDGQHFLSMEYVDGEDLASLLRRVGRFPIERGLAIAGQLAAGLAAAHAQGVLHRDLKPANVMIDGRGRVRLADFGLAGLAGSVAHEDIASGTPAYMAPEQFEGREVSVRSDLYALGLVLYEVFTGRRAIQGGSLPEIAEAHRSATPPALSMLIEGLDPRVEQVILSCLEKDPARRPPSALAVMCALPGGDPFAAALAAGETPSPAMVAAAGGSGRLEPIRARALLAAVIAGLGLAYAIVFGLRLGLPQRVPLPKSPAVLADRAEEMLARLGWGEPALDRDFRLDYDRDAARFALRNAEPALRDTLLASGRPATIRFWYRRDPGSLEPRHALGVVTPDDPPVAAPGAVIIALDPEGRLLGLRGVPRAERAPIEGEPDWARLLEAAGLDRRLLSSAAPQRLPRSFADARAAWVGHFPGLDQLPIRVEAAAYHGLPVHFEILGPWTAPDAGLVIGATGLGGSFFQIFFGLVVVGAALLARRNLRLGRGDRRGAFRLAAFAFGASFLEWLFSASHVGTAGEIRLFNRGVAWSLFTAASLWVLYVALEPYVRRLWPETLVSWTRLLAGAWRDPLVGRDFLVGQLFGVAFILMGALSYVAPLALGQPQRISAHAQLHALMGGRYLLSELVGAPLLAVNVALFYLFLLVALRALLRARRLAEAAFVVVVAMSQIGAWAVFFGAIHWIDWAVAALDALIVMTLVSRFGLVSAASMFLILALALRFPAVTLDVSHWSASSLIVPIVVLLALSLQGYRACVGPAGETGRFAPGV